MEIIETQTADKCEDVQSQIHQARVEWARMNGYTIVVASNVPGVPDGTEGIAPIGAGQITWRWDVPRETPDSTYEIEALPSVLPPNQIEGEWQEDFVQRTRPVEWSQGYSGDQFNSQFDPNTMEV